MGKWFCEKCGMFHSDIFSKKCSRIRQALWRDNKCPECKKSIDKKDAECPFCDCDFDTYKYRDKYYPDI